MKKYLSIITIIITIMCSLQERNAYSKSVLSPKEILYCFGESYTSRVLFNVYFTENNKIFFKYKMRFGKLSNGKFQVTTEVPETIVEASILGFNDPIFSLDENIKFELYEPHYNEDFGMVTLTSGLKIWVERLEGVEFQENVVNGAIRLSLMCLPQVQNNPAKGFNNEIMKRFNSNQ